jgi:hypothetical protein
MGDAGLTDPATGAVRSGLTTNWLLACSGDQSDGLAVGTLDGRVEPSVRSWTLDQGAWGVGFDVELSVAVAVLSRQPLYWSTGSA